MAAKKNTISEAISALYSELDDLRDRVAELQAERSEVVAARRPVEDVKASLRSWIRGRGSAFEPSAGNAVYHDGAGLISPSLLRDTFAGADPQVALPALALKLEAALCHLAPEAVLDALVATVPDAQGDGLVLTTEEREKRLQSIDRRITTAEREEERLIRQAERVGVEIQRRDDANPAVVLMSDDALGLQADAA